MSIYLNADCMNPETGLPSYPDKWFDLAIVDPPYKDETDGLTVGYSRDFGLETFRQPKKEFFIEVMRVSTNQIFWGFNYYLEFLPNTDCVICWFKHQNGHFSECEYAWCSIGKSRHFDRSYQKDLYNKIHPTQKPIALYRWLLTNYAKPGMRLLDTHVGSASSLVAFEEMGFEYVGFELDADYYRESTKRLEAHRKQQSLFSGKEIFEASKPATLF